MARPLESTSMFSPILTTYTLLFLFLVPMSGTVPPHLGRVDRRGSALAMTAVQVLACLPASVRVRPTCLSLHRSPLSFASSSAPRARLSPPLHAHVGFRPRWP